MKQTKVFLAIVATLILLAVTNLASAQYNPQLGRFHQRDPFGVRPGQVTFVNGAPQIVGTNGPMAGGGMRPNIPPQVRSAIEVARVIHTNSINQQRRNSHIKISQTPTGTEVQHTYDSSQSIVTPSDIVPTSQYQDGMNLYQYCLSNPKIYVDPLGLCIDTLKFFGHGMSTQCDVDKKSLAKDKCIPEFMTNGTGDNATMLTVDDIRKECKNLCCNATLKLYACGIGKNPSYMKSLASGCIKIKKVCGYTRALRYVPGTNITLPMPWRWNCIDVN